jgi:delta24-sterol reductase
VVDRPAAVIVFLLPVSVIVTWVLKARDWLGVLLDAPCTHESRVARVRGEVLARCARPASERGGFLCTARAPWQNLSTRFATYKAKSKTVYVGDFTHVLRLDEQALTVTLEPQVDVEAATRFLVPRGYMLATTLEIGEASIGGLAMAVGMTTASHRYGLLQETVTAYEVVTGDGRVLSVTRDGEHAELYHALPWSHGSLALLVGLTLKVISVKPYVEVLYKPMCGGLREYCAEIRRVSVEAQRPADFVEATLFSRDECVVMTGRFVERPDLDKGEVNRVLRWYKRWFYTHVRDMLPGRAERVEYVPTYEYIFRHSPAIFWTIKDQLPEAYSNDWALFRWLLGWMMPPKVQFLKLPATAAIKNEMMYQRVYQDVVLPMGTGRAGDELLEQAVAKAADLFEIWPLLVYPSRIYDHGAAARQGLFRKPLAHHLLPGTNYAMYFDLGIYGIPAKETQGKPFKMVTCSREMEELTRRIGGCPFLYANTFMDRNEFERMLDLRLYDKVRRDYHCEQHFPHLFDKTQGCQSFDWRDKLAEEEGRAPSARAKRD